MPLDDVVARVQRQRALLLEKVYEATGGDTTTPVDFFDLAEAAGISPDEADRALTHLAAQHLLDGCLGGTVRLTAIGQRMLEHTARLLHRSRASSHPAARLTRPTPNRSDLVLDCFLSHASEDKDAIARPLYEGLAAAGVSVWFDEAVLEIGDSLRRKIDNGLARCRFGIVILSPSFFAKEWPQQELDGLMACETASGEKKILPIWHGLDRDAVAARSPILAGRYAGRSSEGIASLVRAILTVVRRETQSAREPREANPADMRPHISPATVQELRNAIVVAFEDTYKSPQDMHSHAKAKEAIEALRIKRETCGTKILGDFYATIEAYEKKLTAVVGVRHMGPSADPLREAREAKDALLASLT